MWRCTACDYQNEDWDDHCAKCGALPAAPDPAPDDLDFTGSNVIPTEPGAPTGVRPTRRISPVALISLLVISVSIVGIAAVLWLAWQRGLLFSPEPDTAPASVAASTEAVPEDTSATPEDITPVTAVPQDAFGQLLLQGTKVYKPFRASVEVLADTRDYLAGCPTLSPHQGGWSTTELADLEFLATQSAQLVDNYQEYSMRTAKHTDEKYSEVRQIILDEFNRQFLALYKRLGGYYQGDLTGTHRAYLLSDTIVQTLEQSGDVDTLSLRTAWNEATKQREQFLLDLTLDEEFKQIDARDNAAIEIQHRFRDTIYSMPAPEIRHDTLSKGAEDLLSLLDSYADTWEDFCLEFEEFQLTLPERQESIRLRNAINDYRRRIEDSHLYCFTEVYRFYAQDKDIQHEAYWKLQTHLAFAEQHWPERIGEYRAVYTKYTEEWDLNFRF